MKLAISGSCIATYIILLSTGIGWSQVVMKDSPDLVKIDVIEHLGDQIPLDLHHNNI